MKASFERKLFHRFRFLRPERVECDDGWFDIVWRLCEEIEAEVARWPKAKRRRFRIATVKEKFAALRVYMTHHDEGIDALISTAVALSRRVCERCGGPGKLRSRPLWFKTLCAPCLRAVLRERKANVLRIRKMLKTGRKVISGGQTGADRGALDAAIASGKAHGGWCPKGRRAEDGRVPDKYALEETPSSSYRERTELNVKGSDGTVVFTRGKPTGGSLLAIRLAKKHGKPLLELDMEKFSVRQATNRLWGWMLENGVAILNVAGSRESKAPGIGADVLRIVASCLERL